MGHPREPAIHLIDVIGGVTRRRADSDANGPWRPEFSGREFPIASKPKKTEAELWNVQEGTAELALEFSIAFLGCRTGPNHNVLLDDKARNRLLAILRAVSIVESRHGTAGKNQPARDPFQCGNPRDNWWREFTGQAGNGSRFRRLPGLGNLWANQLGDATEKDPSFPAAASRSVLVKLADGHDNAAFSPAHSYVWGTLYLLHLINTKAGDSSYQCGDLSRDRLVDGAVAYNGGGVADYRTRITNALAEFGDPLATSIDATAHQIGLLAETLGALDRLGRPVAKLRVNFLNSTSLASVSVDFHASTADFGLEAAHSGELKLGQKVPNDSEVHVCGQISKRIKRSDPEFADLVENRNGDIVFKDEEDTGADRMMSPRLKDGLDRLASLVLAEWTGVKLRVTEAWDENNEHHGASLHYEGRAADLTTSPPDGGKLGRLGQLAVNAGLDWVFFENSAHVHVSVRR